MNKLNLIFISVLIMIIPVYAESGSITLIDNSFLQNYQGGNGGPMADDTTKFDFYTTGYNQIYSIYIDFQGSFTYATDGRSSGFTITSCGNGGGTVSYSKISHAIAYYFTNPSIITCSPIVISYDSNLWNDFTPTNANSATVQGLNPALSTPLVVHGGSGITGICYPGSCNSFIPWLYTVNVATSVTNTYNITYQPSLKQLFTTAINKSNIATKVIIQNVSGTPINYPFQGDSTSNTNNFTVTNVYGSGIVLNMSLSDGVFTLLTINSTDLFPSIIGGNAVGDIQTDKITYNRSQNINITFNISNAINPDIQILKSDGSIFNQDVTNGLNQFKYYFITNNDPLGVYLISLRTFDSNLGEVIINRVAVNITNNGNNAINFEKQQYNIGDFLTINYYSTQPTNYFLLNDTNGNTLINQTTTLTNLSHLRDYFISQNSIVGIWNVTLYNSTGVYLASDTTNINFGIIQPNVTITSTPEPPTSGSSIVGVFGSFGQAIGGTLDTDSDGNIASDLHNKSIGMDWFYFLLLIVFLIIVFGTWKKATGKR